jgi:hypothetical protein
LTTSTSGCGWRIWLSSWKVKVPPAESPVIRISPRLIPDRSKWFKPAAAC